MRQAEQVEAELLAEVAAGKHQRSAMTLGQLLDEWLGWRESNGSPSPRPRCITTPIVLRLAGSLLLGLTLLSIRGRVRR